ncbi:hypothetical protein L1049_017895 [Liquidambar formosana]|uniref:Uncharacterized protein n=1 Tax=Liquidambar formosana TaxID=63359 RepID=A0AAP0R9I6_LIQFO
MERYKDIRALALPVPQHGRFLAGCGERWLAFYRTARIVGRGRGEGNGNRRHEGKGQHKKEEGEMSETGTGIPSNVDVRPTQIIPSDRSPSTHEREIYKFLFSNSYFLAFSSAILFMLGILQVTNKDNVASVFATYPANLRAFIIATVIHYFAIATTLALSPDTRNSLLAGFVAFFSGAFSVILAIWMFLPLWLGWLIFTMWFLLLVMVGCDLFRDSIQNLYQKSKEKLSNRLNWLMGRNSTG